MLSRMREIVSFPQPLTFDDLWVLVVRSRVRYGGEWLQSFLWEYRLNAWLVSLKDGRACRTCGKRISAYEHPGKVYCCNACKLKGHRARTAGKLTPFLESVDEAQKRIEQLDAKLDECRGAFREDRFRGTVLPPDLSKLDHLPVLPGRCGRCSRGTSDCHHTGHVCLFSGTASDLT
jgi:hypothetical protein